MNLNCRLHHYRPSPLVALLVSNQKKKKIFVIFATIIQSQCVQSELGLFDVRNKTIYGEGLRLFSQWCEHAAQVLQTDLLPGITVYETQSVCGY